jgi:4-amino-4-deoxy-L-arabinose transferase-like glycosyltransferase
VPRTPRRPRFSLALGLIVLVAAGLRITYVLAVTQHDERLYDATWYELSARVMAEGEGFFVDPFKALADPDADEPNADHPPLTVIALLPGALLGPGQAGELAMRFTMVLIGCGTVALVGVLGRRLRGEALGLLAAAIAAVDPNLWMNDGLIMSEALATLLTLGIAYGSYRVLTGDRSLRWAAALGALVALAALARAELGLLGPLLVAPVLLVTRDRGWGRRVLATGVAFLVLLGPWVAFNMARFEEPTTISTGLGLALRSGNCDTTYYGDKIGWSAVFEPCTPPRRGVEQSVWDAQLRRDALTYMRHEVRRMPVVALARVGRIWNVYRVTQSVELSGGEGRPAWAAWMGAVATWVLVPLAVVGGLALRRRGQRIWPLVVSISVTTLVVLAGLGGLLRYRAPAEPALVLLAAAGLWALVEARRPAPGLEPVGDQGAADAPPALAER